MNQNMPTQGIDLKQGVYRTDPAFMVVTKERFPIKFDLAASADNTQVQDFFYDEQENALSEAHNWAAISMALGGYLWLNPPYDDIGTWARRCAVESTEGAKILFLVPASTGSNWYRNYVEDFAKVDLLNGRLIFDFLYPEDYMDKATAKKNIIRVEQGLPPEFSPKAGKHNTDPYPKDMMLCIFDRDIPVEQRVARTWRWRTYAGL